MHLTLLRNVLHYVGAIGEGNKDRAVSIRLTGVLLFLYTME